MERATQSNSAKSDHPSLPPPAGRRLEEFPRVGVRVRLRQHLDGGGLEWRIEDHSGRLPRLERFDWRQSMRTKSPFAEVRCRDIPSRLNLETGRRFPRQIRGAMLGRRHPLPGSAQTTFNADGRSQCKTIGQAAPYQAL